MGIRGPRGGVYRPARPRTQPDDTSILDMSTLPLYGVGVDPLELPKLGNRTGIIVPQGEYGGLLYTMDPGAVRPQAGTVGRPIYRLLDSGVFGWRTSRAWGSVVLEFYAWNPDEEPSEQLEQILRWSQGFAQPTVDVTATVATPTATETTNVSYTKGDPGALFALQPNNQYSTIRNNAPGFTLYIASTVARLAAAGTRFALAAGESFGPWSGPFAYQGTDTLTFDVVEALT